MQSDPLQQLQARIRVLLRLELPSLSLLRTYNVHEMSSTQKARAVSNATQENARGTCLQDAGRWQLMVTRRCSRRRLPVTHVPQQTCR